MEERTERARSYRSSPVSNPPSCGLIQPVKRPDHGGKGELVHLLVNFFKIKYDRTRIYIYKVAMSEQPRMASTRGGRGGRGGRGRGGRGGHSGPPKPPPPITHSGTISKILWNTVRDVDYRDYFPNPHRVVFDDFEHLFTPDMMPFKGGGITLHGDHPDKEGARVDIRFECLEVFDLDLRGDCDAKGYQWTSIFLKNLSSQYMRYVPAENCREPEKEISERFAHFDGGLYFIPRTANAPKIEIQPGVEAWLGLYASVRRMENFDPIINYGLVNKLFMTLSLDLISFYLLILKERMSGPSKESIELNNTSCMTAEAMQSFTKQLHKIRLRCDCVPGIKDGLVVDRVLRHYEFVELKNTSADREILKVEDQTARERPLVYKMKNGREKKEWKKWRDVTIYDWYAAQGIQLKYPKLPLCVVKTGKNTDVLPMEVLITRDTPQKYIKLLSFYARMRIPRLLARSPAQHHKFTNKMITEKLEYEKDPFMKAMNVSFDSKMIECEGRVVEPCTVLGKNDSDEKLAKLEVRKETGEFFVTRAVETSNKRIRFVVCKLTDAVDQKKIEEFYRELVKKCLARGFIVPPSDQEQPPIYKNLCEGNMSLARTMEEVKGLFSRGQKDDEVLVFLFFTKMIDDLYGEIKYLSDIRFGVVSQVVDEQTVRSACTIRDDERPSDYKSIYHHLCLKLNAKLGGVNQTVEEKDEQPYDEDYDTMPKNERTMFIGIDVIHPSPNSPIRDCSLAAIVASMDKNAAKYAARIKVNTRCNESVQLFDEHFSWLLAKYHAVNDFLPERIVVLRDGVSDSEMVKAASQELNSIKESWRRCANGKKCPPLTYIVAQKRHKTRFYKRPSEKEGQVTNPPMGTVVDKDVVTPHMFDFYMVSHYTLVGTTKPIHYTVVYDDCNSGADAIQELVFRLCFLYARCSKPVSLPAPVYYAHLACERAAFQHEYALREGEVEEIVDKGETESEQQYANRVEMQALRIEKKLQVSEDHPGMYFI